MYLYIYIYPFGQIPSCLCARVYNVCSIFRSLPPFSPSIPRRSIASSRAKLREGRGGRSPRGPVDGPPADGSRGGGAPAEGPGGEGGGFPKWSPF